MKPGLIPLALLLLGACAAPQARHPLATCEEPGALLPLPSAVWDDGNSTFLRFSGNQRLPVPYVVEPDGEEALVEFTVTAVGLDHLLMLHRIAREIRLRDGDSVACIVNDAWSPGGSNPGTGTVSPDVLRVLRDEEEQEE